MSRRVVKEDGEVIGFCCLSDGLQQGAAHRDVVGAVGELSYDQTADSAEDTAQAQTLQHAVDMVVVLANIFDEQDGCFGAGVNNLVQTIGRPL